MGEGSHVEAAEPDESNESAIPDSVPDEDETIVARSPPGDPSPVETALAQYADSIERLSAEYGTEMDPYTKGFVAGLRAAIKVAANVIRS
jgi:hypothetical protein